MSASILSLVGHETLISPHGVLLSSHPSGRYRFPVSQLAIPFKFGLECFPAKRHLTERGGNDLLSPDSLSDF